MAKVGIAHIFASYNNIHITVTDITGAETLAKATGGMVVKAARDESSPYAAMKAADQIAALHQGEGVRHAPRPCPRARREPLALAGTRRPGRHPRPFARGREDPTHRGRHPGPSRRHEAEGRPPRTAGVIRWRSRSHELKPRDRHARDRGHHRVPGQRDPPHAARRRSEARHRGRRVPPRPDPGRGDRQGLRLVDQHVRRGGRPPTRPAPDPHRPRPVPTQVRVHVRRGRMPPLPGDVLRSTEKGPCTVYAKDVVPLGDAQPRDPRARRPDRTPRRPPGAPRLRDRGGRGGAGAREVAGRPRASACTPARTSRSRRRPVAPTPA